MNNDNSQLCIEDPMDLLIVLLYAPGKTRQYGEPIEGITRLQKLMFLLQQGLGPQEVVDIATQLGFDPYKMGPYSDQIRDILSELVSENIVTTHRLEYIIPDDGDNPPEIEYSRSGQGSKKVESFRYSLSEYGKNIGNDLWLSMKDEEQKGLSKFKAFFNDLSLRQLLIFTYERFPEFTTRSEIKKDLGLA